MFIDPELFRCLDPLVIQVRSLRCVHCFGMKSEHLVLRYIFSI